MEIWKDIEGFEGRYQVSNLGRIKSLAWEGTMPNGCKRVYGDKILKPRIDKFGYTKVCLRKDNKDFEIKIHRLVYEAFNGKTSLQIDHINNIKNDNVLSNLQALTQRDNLKKYHLSTNKSSKFIGVSYREKYNYWDANIWKNKKPHYLGRFKTEIEAANAYQEALANI